MNIIKKDIWVTSDTHFNHENIIKYCNRPFGSVEEMNETLIENWNSVVKPGDKVYHLGDVFMGDKEGFKKLWPRLNGQKRLIVGNYDDIKFLSCGSFFKKVGMWRMFPEYQCVLTHVPLRLNPESVDHKYNYNLHGHLHDLYVRHPNGNKDTRYFNCCVEHHNFTPIHLQSTMEKVKMGYG